MLLFSENNTRWQEIPNWVEFLIQTGYCWPNSAPEERKIALISMPCDSAAAGLISLGVLIRDLGDPRANNIDGHYDYLLRYARQYLHNCRNCVLSKCDTDLKKCGHMSRATGRLKSRKHPRMEYKISEKTDFKNGQLVFHYSDRRKVNGIQYPGASIAVNWYIEGELPVEIDNDKGSLDGDTYSSFIKGANIISENLKRTWYGVCLAGRVTGKEATKKVFASIRFKNGKYEYGLEKLLTVNGWGSFKSMSRMAYFNSRTDNFETHISAPRVVIADGDKSFLRAIARKEFQRSDVIGVIHRVLDRADLEAVGNQVNTLRQWYNDDHEAIKLINHVPAGINMVILRRRVI